MKKLVRIGIAAAMAVGLAVAVAQPASATAGPWSASCLNTVEHNTALDNPSNNATQWCQVQGGPAQAFSYTGPVNGVPGVNTYKGLQRYLAAYYGYTAGIDGVLGVNSYKAMQRAANTIPWGAPLTVDGTMSQTDWAAWGYFLKVAWFGD